MNQVFKKIAGPSKWANYKINIFHFTMSKQLEDTIVNQRIANTRNKCNKCNTLRKKVTKLTKIYFQDVSK